MNFEPAGKLLGCQFNFLEWTQIKKSERRSQPGKEGSDGRYCKYDKSRKMSAKIGTVFEKKEGFWGWENLERGCLVKMQKKVLNLFSPKAKVRQQKSSSCNNRTTTSGKMS